MAFPKRWKPGDKITAERLNLDQLEALRQRRSGMSLGNGSSLIGEALGNQSANMQRAGLKLVFAMEDFEAGDVGESHDLIYSIVDPVPSGKCLMMRMNVQTGEYEEEVEAKPFRSYDVIAHLNGVQPRAAGDIFYVGYNEDTKRWEVIGGTGIRLQAAHVLSCIGKGWHEIELCEWDGRPEFPDESESVSASESCDNSYEAGTNSRCRMPCEFEPCNTLEDGIIPMDECLVADQDHYPNYAHTTRQLPMLTGGFIKVIRRFGTPEGELSLSDSLSASESADDAWYFDVVDGVWPVIEMMKENFLTCTDEETGICTVVRTDYQRILFEGYECEVVQDEECPGGPETSSGSNPS